MESTPLHLTSHGSDASLPFLRSITSLLATRWGVQEFRVLTSLETLLTKPAVSFSVERSHADAGLFIFTERGVSYAAHYDQHGVFLSQEAITSDGATSANALVCTFLLSLSLSGSQLISFLPHFL